MGSCFITRRGGGTSKAFAVIAVTYPSGSLCTCTDGTKTLKLKNTSGQGIFIIPYAAMWTVTATDETNTKSESIEITTEGQSVSVTLSYELIINFNKSVSASDSAGYTPDTDYKVLDTYTDLSSYTTLTFTVTSRTWSNVGNGYIRFGLNPTKAEAPTIYTQANASGATTVTLDISSVNGGYIGISCSAIAAGVSGTSKSGATVSTIIAT